MQHRVVALDLLRFVAAMLVLAHHWWWVGRPQIDLLGWFPTRFVANAGYFGVVLFFMISGFVIVMSAQGKTPSEFVRHRAIRLYPAFWVCCALTAIVGGNRGYATDPIVFLLNLTMFPSAFDVPMIDGVYWTLALEAKFYFLIWVVLACGLMNRFEWVLWGWLLLAVLPLPGPVQAVIMSTYAPFFVAGCAAFLLSEKATAFRWLLLVSAAAAALWAAGRGLPHMARIMNAPGSESLGLAVIAVMLAAMTAVALGLVRLPDAKVFAILGAMTYPTYLLHKEIGYRFFAFASPSAGTFVVCLIWILAMAWAVNRWVELPLRRYLDAAYPNKKPPSTTIVVPVVQREAVDSR